MLAKSLDNVRSLAVRTVKPKHPATGALVLALITALLPDRWTRWIWPGALWATPVLAMITCVYLTIPWFRQ